MKEGEHQFRERVGGHFPCRVSPEQREAVPEAS